MLTNIEHERIAFASGLPTAGLFGIAADAELAADSADTARCHIEEARAQFADEDFANEEMRELATFAKRLRGDNRAELMAIIEMMQSRIDELARASEYGIDELCKARDAL